jgi:hypothetical protein
MPAGNIDQCWACVAINSDGAYMLAAVNEGRLYRGVNYGANWLEVILGGHSDAGFSWRNPPDRWDYYQNEMTIQLLPAGPVVPVVIPVGASTVSYPGLASGSSYQVKIRAGYDETNHPKSVNQQWSEWLIDTIVVP